MGRERIQKEIMPKRFQDQDRTFDEWIIVRQVLIIPNELSLQRRHVHDEAGQDKDGAANPRAL